MLENIPASVKKIHLIAIGGAIMHNIAIFLKKKGYDISGSDDMLFDPALSQLKENGLEIQAGWFPENISSDIDLIVLGMHAKKDNPELQKALELKIPVLSFPEFFRIQASSKKRIVVAGSHGKTSITSIIIHVLKKEGFLFDFLVGAKIKGFDTMVHLSEQSEVAVYEGDEYLSSCLLPVPKFHIYEPHIAVISGIAWDHANVFPTEAIYIKQFERFLQTVASSAQVFYYAEDEKLEEVCQQNKREDISLIPYHPLTISYENNKNTIEYKGKSFPIRLFGKHNAANISVALSVCDQMGISAETFFKHLETFEGPEKRLQKISDAPCSVFLDFAHSPSKVKATVEAVREKYPDRTLVCFLELHTFSSLHSDFINNYKNTLKASDISTVYIAEEIAQKKGNIVFTQEVIREAFNDNNIAFIQHKENLQKEVSKHLSSNTVLLFMSSGSWSANDVQKWIAK